MNESDVRDATRFALMGRGYWPQHFTDGIKCSRCHQIIVPASKGKPDLLLVHPAGIGSVVEVKDVKVPNKELGLAFTEISTEQRQYLDDWDIAASGVGPGAFISIGLILPSGSRTFLSDIWVVPWKVWKSLEQSWTACGKTSVGIDPTLYKRANKVPLEFYLRDFQFDIYKLKRIKESDGKPGWALDDAHPLAVGHLLQDRHRRQNDNDV